MLRRRRLLEFTPRDAPVIEIGPYFNPLVPKRAGWNTLILDVFDTETLRARAAEDANIPPERLSEIEEVDLVGPAHHLGDLVAARGLEGQVGAILSSHNIEHMPDPVGFLQGAARALRPGGVLSLAVPDKRGCFDFFRPPTALPAWLAAHEDRREQPTPEQVFEHNAMHASADGRESGRIAFIAGTPAARVDPWRTLTGAHDTWRAARATPAESRPYTDAHCWVFTPSSFAALVNDAGFLGYHPLRFRKRYPGFGHEFIAHLEKPRQPAPWDEAAFYAERAALMRAATRELAVSGGRFTPLRVRLEEAARALAKRLR
ncbi:MAG: class I SAM-dependent methyltransferase [Rubritepida sp.]|nr:class I SAM-dependent methyltransferase [Rubritepida sp.]